MCVRVEVFLVSLCCDVCNRFRLAFVFCTTFFIESLIILVSGVAYEFFVRNFVALQSVYLIVNIFSILVVVLTTRSTLVLHMSKKREVQCAYAFLASMPFL